MADGRGGVSRFPDSTLRPTAPASRSWRGRAGGGPPGVNLHPPAPFTEGLPGRFAALSLFGSRGVLEVKVPTGMMGYDVFDVTADGGRTWVTRPAPEAAGYNNTGSPLTFSASDAD